MNDYLKSFLDIPAYSDPGSENQTCRDVLPRGVVPGLLVGHDVIEGPGHNGLGRHAGWHQVFVVLAGRGMLVRGAERIAIQAPCVVHIPPDTEHDVLVAAGERIEYVYINKYLADEA
ncbi:MAG TPA: cupin domain-containing protein [Anaerolineae bacterium]|nr:cupin domain-containing protein [Anaerolineae bacterium]HPL29379.1 cupin domain-containing protein [Anaerolineae bacterium]